MSEPGRIAIIVSIATAAGAVIGAMASPLANYFINERQMDVKMVELGIGILRAPPQEGGEAMRGWAIKAVERGSRSPFSEAERAALMKQELQLRWDGGLQWDAPFLQQQFDIRPKK